MFFGLFLAVFYLSLKNLGSSHTSRKPSTARTEKWLFEKDGDGSYKITNAKSGKCLDVASGTGACGNNVWVWDDNGSDAQRWFVYGEQGSYMLRAKCGNCVLDLYNGSGDDGNNMHMWECNGTYSQRFTIDKLISVQWDIGDVFYAKISNTKTGLYLTNDDDDNIRTYSKSQDASRELRQIWRFEKQWDETYRIINLATGKCIDLDNAQNRDGANVWAFENNGTVAQEWLLFSKEGDTFVFQTKANRRVLDIDNASEQQGTNVQIWKYNATPAQTFYIQKLDDSYINNVSERARFVSVESVSLNQSKIELKVGQKIRLIAEVIPANATNKKVNFSSSNVNTATVDANGDVTAKAPGKTAIIVRTEDGNYAANCQLIVTEEKKEEIKEEEPEQKKDDMNDDDENFELEDVVDDVSEMEFQIDNCEYTGMEVTPSVKVMDVDDNLVEGKDFRVIYENNVEIGKAYAVITGIGEYTGTKKVAFYIIPGKVKNLKAGKRSENTVVIKWNGYPGVQGYELKAAYPGTDKFKMIGSTVKNKVKIKKLKAYKAYTITITPFILLEDGTKLYGSSSDCEVGAFR